MAFVKAGYKDHSMGWGAWKASWVMGKVRSKVIRWGFKCMFETLHGIQLEGGQGKRRTVDQDKQNLPTRNRS